LGDVAEPMPGRVDRSEVRRRQAGERAGVSVAVCHASQEVDRHVAELRRVAHYRVWCVPQRFAATRVPANVDAVLWELAPGRRPNRRQLRRLARRAVLVSYSVNAARELVELSRLIGFRTHLRAPLRRIDVEHQLALAAPVDLATRLRRVGPTLRRHLRRGEALLELARGIQASLDPARVGDAIAEQLARWLPVPVWAVVVGDKPEPRVVGAFALSAADYEVVRGLGVWVQRQGELASADLAADRRFAALPPVAALGFPLVSRGRTIGAAVGLDGRASARMPRLDGETAGALRPLLEVAAATLDSALKLQQAAALSVTDDLTKLYNSRYLAQALRRETKRASRSGRPLSVLFIDLDGFKSVNDAHGHLMGSQALVEAAHVIRTTVRETDVVARFGGDEFTVVLPDTGSEGAVSLAERVRERLAAHRFLTGEGLHLTLSASVGVATLPDVAVSAEGLLRAADQAMYWVKNHGKNGVHVAGAPEADPPLGSGREGTRS
jgi:diguanylate cyclase (GGDEF)-like protein